MFPLQPPLALEEGEKYLPELNEALYFDRVLRLKFISKPQVEFLYTDHHCKCWKNGRLLEPIHNVSDSL